MGYLLGYHYVAVMRVFPQSRAWLCGRLVIIDGLDDTPRSSLDVHGVGASGTLSAMDTVCAGMKVPRLLDIKKRFTRASSQQQASVCREG